MHELSVAGAILGTATKHAAGRRVTVVSLRVGRLRGVVADSLRFYFEIVAREGPCEHARLEIEEIELRLRCSACTYAWEPAEPIFRCPGCASTDVAVVAGQELEVDYIEVEEEEPACIAQG